MKITARNLQKIITINPVKVRKIAFAVITKLKLKPQFSANLNLNLYFVKNSTIKKLNKEFFDKNSLTDVISFNLEEGCAEIFIAPRAVKTNANYFCASFKEELYRCIIHGILHVFGFEDENKKKKAIMWKRQETLLREVFKKYDLQG